MYSDDYPRLLVGDYRERKTTRELFIKSFAAWQKSRGIDYDCRGTGDDGGTYVEYRNHRARIKNGVLVSVYGTARSVFEFRRKVDFAMNRAATWAR